MKLKKSLVFAPAIALAACATPGPYAEVTGERLGQADPSEAAVRIAGVDGKLDLSGPTTVTLDPGAHMILVRTTRGDRRRMSPEAMLPLMAKPCMRYHIVARHESALSVEPWSLEIKKVEPVGECVAKYSKGEAAKWRPLSSGSA